MTYSKRKSRPKLTPLTFMPSSKLYVATEPSIKDIAKFVSSYGFMYFEKCVSNFLDFTNYTYTFSENEILLITSQPKDRWILDSISFYDPDEGDELTRTLFQEYEWISRRMDTMFSLCLYASMFGYFGSAAEEILTPNLINMINWLEPKMVQCRCGRK